MTKVAFRVDASLDMGIGHVMRCLTLAETLRAGGARCVFVCRAHAGNLLEMIRERGFEVLGLPAPPVRPVAAQQPAGAGDPAHAHWLGVDPAIDARQMLMALGDRRVDWLIVDHYALDARWEARLRPACGRLMVIDDLADRLHDCDILLDQNLNRAADDYAALVPRHCEVLAGPGYALLRPHFAALRSYSLNRRKDVKLRRILVSMGGVDRDNMTGRVLTALADCQLPRGTVVSAVMGATAPWIWAVRELVPHMPFPLHVLVDVRDMAQLMADADLGIGAAGTTAWERCCLGLPTIAVVLAANQRASASALKLAGAVALIREDVVAGSDFGAALVREIDRIRQPGVLASLSAAAAAVTDGTGCALVAKRIARG